MEKLYPAVITADNDYMARAEWGGLNAFGVGFLVADGKMALSKSQLGVHANSANEALPIAFANFHQANTRIDFEEIAGGVYSVSISAKLPLPKACVTALITVRWFHQAVESRLMLGDTYYLAIPNSKTLLIGKSKAAVFEAADYHAEKRDRGSMGLPVIRARRLVRRDGGDKARYRLKEEHRVEESLSAAH